MEKRFERNIPTISEEEQEILKSSRVAIIGLGGLGGYLCEMVARLGVESVVVCDGDVFDETNLNRQLLSSEGNVGMLKAEAAKGWIESINSSAKVDMYCKNISKENAHKILAGCNLVLDGLDNPRARLILEDACADLNIPIIHGAIQGLAVQVGIALPGHNMLHKLFASATNSKVSDMTASQKSTLACTPAFCASLQIAVAVSLLCKNEVTLSDKLLLANLGNYDFTIFPIA